MLRTALRQAIQQGKDSRLTSRLTQTIMKIIQGDTENVRGHRTIDKGDIALLQGFEFNRNARLGNTLQLDYDAAIDRGTGGVSVMILAFIPAVMFASPARATHDSLVAGACEIDFENSIFYSQMERCISFPLDNAEQAENHLSILLTANTDKLVLVVLGIEFYQVVNVEKYSMKNGSFNAMSLIKADHV